MWYYHSDCGERSIGMYISITPCIKYHEYIIVREPNTNITHSSLSVKEFSSPPSDLFRQMDWCKTKHSCPVAVVAVINHTHYFHNKCEHWQLILMHNTCCCSTCTLCKYSINATWPSHIYCVMTLREQCCLESHYSYNSFNVITKYDLDKQHTSLQFKMKVWYMTKW